MSTKRYCSRLTAHWLLPTTVGLAAFLLYIRTLAPTVTGEDAGELIAAAYLLGIPHPPGYPLFCVLGKLFICLPGGNIAYRVNLMSAVFGALSVVMLYLLIHHATRSRLSAVVGSLLFACSKEFWWQSLIAEVYTLNKFRPFAPLGPLEARAPPHALMRLLVITSAPSPLPPAAG